MSVFILKKKMLKALTQIIFDGIYLISTSELKQKKSASVLNDLIIKQLTVSILKRPDPLKNISNTKEIFLKNLNKDYLQKLPFRYCSKLRVTISRYPNEQQNVRFQETEQSVVLRFLLSS